MIFRFSEAKTLVQPSMLNQNICLFSHRQLSTLCFARCSFVVTVVDSHETSSVLHKIGGAVWKRLEFMRNQLDIVNF